MILDFTDGPLRLDYSRFPGSVVIQAMSICDGQKTILATLEGPDFNADGTISYDASNYEADAEWGSIQGEDITVYRWLVDAESLGPLSVLTLRCATRGDGDIEGLLQELEVRFHFVETPGVSGRMWSVRIWTAYVEDVTGDRFESPQDEAERLGDGEAPYTAFPIRIDLPGFDPGLIRDVEFSGPAEQSEELSVRALIALNQKVSTLHNELKKSLSITSRFERLDPLDEG